MKRFTAAVVAAATAVSLSTATAPASDLDTLGNLIITGAAISNGVSEPHAGSARGSSDSSSTPEGGAAWVNFYGSSYKNDIQAGYPGGTTADILWGVGIAAAVVLGAGAFAASQGLIPNMPQLTF